MKGGNNFGWKQMQSDVTVLKFDCYYVCTPI